MSRVFVALGVSVDGYVAGPNRGPKNPLGDRGPSLHEWAFKQQSFLRHLSLPGDGETGDNDRVCASIFDRIGANIMGKRMFDEGEANWPANAPFNNHVFVVTKEKRASWERPGGTVFHFVNEPIERVLERARDAAGNKDVRISGGRDIVRQYLNAGLVDELLLSVTPVIMGEGLRLLEGVDRQKVALAIEETIATPQVTHVRYRVKRA